MGLLAQNISAYIVLSNSQVENSLLDKAVYLVGSLSDTTDEELEPLAVLVTYASISSGCRCLGIG